VRNRSAVVAEAVVAGRPAALLGAGLHFVGRAVAPVGASCRLQLLRRGLVELPALALVGGLAVPAEPEPLEHVEDVLGQLGPVALGVGVLDAQQELATDPARLEPVEQDGAGAPDVQVAGRRGREAQPRRR
jgi:hypothetical protein